MHLQINEIFYRDIIIRTYLKSGSVFDKISQRVIQYVRNTRGGNEPNVIVEMTVNKSLPRLLLYYWEELFISEERGGIYHAE